MRKELLIGVAVLGVAGLVAVGSAHMWNGGYGGMHGYGPGSGWTGGMGPGGMHSGMGPGWMHGSDYRNSPGDAPSAPGPSTKLSPQERDSNIGSEQ